MHGEVVSTEWLTPTMVRVVLSGCGLHAFEGSPWTDAYVNVAIPPSGAPYAAPFDLGEVQASVPRTLRPVRRRYTVRRWEAAARRLTIDVVVHRGMGTGGP